MISEPWDRVLPDQPRWVELRSMLLRGSAQVLGDPDGAVVVDEHGLVGGVVGHPKADVLREAMAELASVADLLVIPESLDHVARMLPSAVPKRAVIHRLGRPFEPFDPGDVEVSSVDDDFVAALPAALASETVGSLVAAVRRVGGAAVSMCATSSMTETLWDVGIDTLEPFQRQGHARACYLALASHLDHVGLQPVWGAYEDNQASLRMAESLGFEPVDELWVIELGGPR